MAGRVPRRADERFEGFVEGVTGLWRGVASAGEVSPLGLQPGRPGITDRFEGGTMIARDHELFLAVRRL